MDLTLVCNLQKIILIRGLQYPGNFVHRAGSYNCGFGEGIITGRSEVIHNAFGNIKSIHWENDSPVIKQ